jgi:hypothetical protein
VDRLPFLRAKAADGELHLRWLKAELSSLRARAPSRLQIFDRLDAEVRGAEARLSDLKVVISAAHPTLMDRGIQCAHLLDAILNKVSVTYVGALRKEGDSERQMRGLVLSASRSSGMSWIQDVVVRLDGTHAVFATFPEIPLLVAPPRHIASLYDMPGLYHELGHTAFVKFSAIGDCMRAAVAEYFDAQRRLGGPLTPGQRAAREERLAAAEQYWTEWQLAELFCDIFATYVCGPAHYASFVELGLRMPYDPFEVVGDPHPPDAARERVCYETLSLAHRAEKLVNIVRKAWKAHEGTSGANHQYMLRCSDELLAKLVGVAISSLEAKIPTLRRYQGSLPSVDHAERLTPTGSLEDVLNQSATILFLAPEHYGKWEGAALDSCARLAQEI